MANLNTSSTYDKLLRHLASKKLHVVNNKILTTDGLNTSIYKQAIPYILNKLNNLYNIADGTHVKSKLLAKTHSNEKFKAMVVATEQFKQTKLNTLVDDIIENENINWCLMHGEEITKLCTVPENVILVFLAPTNRYLKQYATNATNIFELIGDNRFVNQYLKNANCVKNDCVKYATVLYPGQKYFDLSLSPHGEQDTEFYKINGGFYKKKNNYFLKGTDVKFTSDLIKESNNEPAVYFIYACRAANMSLSSKLVEVLYYNEYICNYINKYNIACPQKDEYITDKQCLQLFTKQIKRITNNNVPEFSFSPIKNEDIYKNIDKIYNLIQVISQYRYDKFKTVDTFFDMVFYAFEKLAPQHEFFKCIIALSDTISIVYNQDSINTINTIYCNLFKKNMCSTWMRFIDTYFFNASNNLIYETEIGTMYIDIKNSAENKELLRLILGEFIIYYFYTANSARKNVMTKLFTNIVTNTYNNRFDIFLNIALGVFEIGHPKFESIIYIIPGKLPALTFASINIFFEQYDNIKTEFINAGFFNRQTETPPVVTDKKIQFIELTS